MVPTATVVRLPPTILPFPIMPARRPLFFFSTIGMTLVSGTLLTWSQSEDPEPLKPPPSSNSQGMRGGGPKGESDPFRDLTPEQREALREAVRRAWNDPTVIEARSEVTSAAENYQQVLQSAILRIDPELKEAMTKMRKSTTSSALKGFSGSPSMGGPGRPGGGGPGGRRMGGFEGMVTLERPSFLRDLKPEQQKIYLEAHRKAMEVPSVKEMLEEMKGLRKEDEALRERRVEMITRTHRAIRQAMFEVHPEMAEWLPERTRTGGSGGGGDGRDRKPGDKSGHKGGGADRPSGEDRPPVED